MKHRVKGQGLKSRSHLLHLRLSQSLRLCEILAKFLFSIKNLYSPQQQIFVNLRFLSTETTLVEWVGSVHVDK